MIKYRDFFYMMLFMVLYTFYGVMQQSSVGKTHFIMGKSSQDVPSVPVTQKTIPQSPDIQILFSPDDNIRHHLLHLISAEREAICLAVFMVTDPEVANALCAARKRGVRIELVTDVGCLKDRASKANQLCKSGCAVYIYNPTTSTKRASLMHHKFALFAHNDHGPRIWTGSYNFTKAANNNNKENVIVFSDMQAFDKFRDQFNRLKKQSYLYTHDRIAT